MEQFAFERSRCEIFTVNLSVAAAHLRVNPSNKVLVSNANRLSPSSGCKQQQASPCIMLTLMNHHLANSPLAHHSIATALHGSSVFPGVFHVLQHVAFRPVWTAALESKVFFFPLQAPFHPGRHVSLAPPLPLCLATCGPAAKPLAPLLLPLTTHADHPPLAPPTRPAPGQPSNISGFTSSREH